MPKIGVVVGLDNLGKTPLCKLIQGVNPKISLKKVLTHSEARDLEGEGIRRALSEVHWWSTLSDDEVLLYDRFPWPDDHVYEILGGEKPSRKLGPEHRELEHLIVAHQVSYVYITPVSWENYLKTFADPIVTPEMLPVLRQRYTDFVQRCDRLHVRVMHVPSKWFTFDDAVYVHNWLFTRKADA